MKKAKQNAPKPKEFTANPFAQLKGVKAADKPAEPKAAAPPVKAKVVDREGADLFLLEMADVKRLHEPRHPAGVTKPAPEPARQLVRRIEEEEQHLFQAALHKLHLDKTFQDEFPEDDSLPQARSVNRMRMLRRGTIHVDYELDLHGLTRDEALDALVRFVGGAYHRGQEAVLVITGRGNNSPAGPVLQKAVCTWLRSDGQSMVAEFSAAPSQLGGDGALVVFLKHKNN